MAVVEITDSLVFLTAVGIVAVFEVVNVKVAPNQEGVVVEVTSTSVAVVIVATSLQVVNVKIEVFLVAN